MQRLRRVTCKIFISPDDCGKISSKAVVSRDSFAQFVSLGKFFVAFDVADLEDAAGQNVTALRPAQMFHQVLVVSQRVVEAVTFRRHQQHGFFLRVAKRLRVC